MTKTLQWLIVALAIMLGFVLYGRWAQRQLNVTPEAQREIEKAKER